MISEKFIKPKGTYLLSHSVGLPLKSAKDEVEKEFWQPWIKSSGDEWNFWLSYIKRFQRQLGKFLNSDEKNFCPQTNISSAVTKIIFSLEVSENKNVILLSEEDFPSVAFALQKSQSLGYKMINNFQSHFHIGRCMS